MIRVPCLFNHTLTYRSVCDEHTHMFALCCLGTLREPDAWFLETQVQEFPETGSGLGVLIPGKGILGKTWNRTPQNFSLTIFCDPLNRIRNFLHLSHPLPLKRSETLIFDQHHRLRFRLIHDLTLKGLSAVREMIGYEIQQDLAEHPTPATGPHSQGFKGIKTRLKIGTAS